MKRGMIRTGIIVLILAVLLLLVATVRDPLLYTSERSLSSPFHERLLMTGASPSGSARLLPLMAEVLDATNTITISLKADDLPAAERDLEEYLAWSSSLDNLVIELNLTSSDVEDFRQYNQQNLQDLQEMVNLTARFSELERLDITYREEGNPQQRYVVSYEGEQIRQRAVELSRQYAAREQAVVTTSRLFELGTDEYEGSVLSFADIVRDISVEQEERRIQLGGDPLPVTTNLTLAIRPVNAVFGDTLLWSGELTGGDREGISLRLYLDSIPVAEITTNERGQYRHLMPIQRIRSGTHLAYIAADRSYSPIIPFSVTTTSTTLTLTASPTNEDRTVLITGSLTARGLPVPDAPVIVTLDRTSPTVVETDATGTYRLLLNLSFGRHTVRTQFSARDFPLLPSEAESSVTTGSPPPPPPLAILIPVLVIGICVGGAWWYLHRRSHQGESTVPATFWDLEGEPPPPPLVTATPAPAGDPELPADRVWTLYREGQIQEAVLSLYLYLTSLLSTRWKILPFRTLTPREFAGAVGHGQVSTPLWEFVKRYEGIRYGGAEVSGEDLSDLTTLVSTILAAQGGGED